MKSRNVQTLVLKALGDASWHVREECLLHLIYHLLTRQEDGYRLDYAGVVAQLCLCSEDATKRVRHAAVQALSVLAQLGDKGKVLELLY